MQKIQVEMLTSNGESVFVINGVVLGQIWKQQHDLMSELKRNIHPYGCRQDYHYTLTEAIDFVKESITAYFGYVGIPVEFIAK